MSSPLPSDAAPSRTRVLVVDDDPANLSTFVRIFRRKYEVVVAESGSAALEALRQAPFDVALIDYTMPGMSGVELMKAMLVSHPGVVRLMLTAHFDLPEIVAAQRSGLAMAVINKPWERQEIEQAIGACRAPEPSR